jgi:hypothetical protein
MQFQQSLLFLATGVISTFSETLEPARLLSTTKENKNEKTSNK